MGLPDELIELMLSNKAGGRWPSLVYFLVLMKKRCRSQSHSLHVAARVLDGVLQRKAGALVVLGHKTAMGMAGAHPHG